MTMTALDDNRLMLVGNPSAIHVGAHLLRASQTLNLETRFFNHESAFAGPKWWVRINWRLLGHRPAKLTAFSAQLVEMCRTFRPKWLLTTGIAPLTARALQSIRQLGVICLNFLTDDPWNATHRAPWFLEALPFYSQVFSPRHANLADLTALSCKKNMYLPFAYAPDQHFVEMAPAMETRQPVESDVVFIGGADADRLVAVLPLIQAGYRVDLYGGYWERYAQTKNYARGMADPARVRALAREVKVNLCLVRRANRDGHVMRSYEIPAMGGCMLVEDTPDHRKMFGAEGECVLYFQDAAQMVAKLKLLIDDAAERKRLCQTNWTQITRAPNTYRDRLQTMLMGLHES